MAITGTPVTFWIDQGNGLVPRPAVTLDGGATGQRNVLYFEEDTTTTGWTGQVHSADQTDPADPSPWCWSPIDTA